MDFICLGVRIPKSGSASLIQLLREAFAGQQVFYLPDTLDPASRITSFQNWRFRKSQIRNLLKHYGTMGLKGAFAQINARANNGDLIAGGHVDFPTVQKNLEKDAKIITILRHPAERCRSEYDYSRRNYFKKNVLTRFDSKLLKKIAGKYSFTGYLDFLLEHADAYGDIACAYLGWDKKVSLADFYANNIFHSGVLEENRNFARGLSEKLGKKLSFPHRNRTAREEKSKIDSEARRKLERLYAKDFELYAWLRKHY